MDPQHGEVHGIGVFSQTERFWRRIDAKGAEAGVVEEADVRELRFGRGVTRARARGVPDAPPPSPDRVAGVRAGRDLRGGGVQVVKLRSNC